MAAGTTDEGEALDYASTVVHALAPTQGDGSSQVRTYFDNYLSANNIAVRAEGQAERLNTAFTVGGAPDPESFVADQLAVTRAQWQQSRSQSLTQLCLVWVWMQQRL